MVMILTLIGCEAVVCAVVRGGLVYGWVMLDERHTLHSCNSCNLHPRYLAGSSDLPHQVYL